MMNNHFGDTWTLQFGAQPYSGGTEFRVWALSSQHVEVEYFPDGSDGKGILCELEPRDDGYFSKSIDNVLPGMRYRYWLDGRGPFPDPASRYQPEGVHGPSQVVDPTEFLWNDTNWHGIELEDLVIYELHVGAFTPEGTFDGLINKLAHIKDLGVTAIQIMPVADFPGDRNWGYDGVDLFAPAHIYGGPEALRRLVDAAHARGIAIILDVVFNHLGPEGNYLGVFSNSYFTDKHSTDWGVGINFVGRSGRPVRDFFVANACYWAHEYHMDGLRLDAIQAIRDTEDPHIIEEITISVRDSLPPDRSFLIIAEDEYNDPKLVQPVNKRGFGLDAVYADDFHHQVHVALTGEKMGYYMDYDGTIADMVTTLKQGWWFVGQESAWRSKNQNKVVEVGRNADRISPPHFIYCIQNHDQVGNRPLGERLNLLVSPYLYRAASALLLLSPYTPLLFMGQEWAASTPFQFFTDFHDQNAIRGVVVGRPKDMDHLYPGLGNQSPNPQELSTFQRSKLHWQEKNKPAHAGIFQLYRDLLQMRKDLPALQKRERKDFSVAMIGTNAFALRRNGPTPQDTVLIIFNLRGRLRYNLMENVVTAPPFEHVWKIHLDSEESKYSGRADTRLEEGSILEMNGGGTLLLVASSTREITAQASASAQGIQETSPDDQIQMKAGNMAAQYTNDSQKEAEEIARALKQLDVILANDELKIIYAGDPAQLRKRIKDLLVDIDTNISLLQNVERQDFYGTDPTLARQRVIHTRKIEEDKITFEYEIMPEVEKLTVQTVEYVKQNPPASVDESKLPPALSGEKWTVKKVIETADKFMDQALKAAQVVTKAYAFVKVLGILTGIPIP